MGITVCECLRHMNEAMVAENTGAVIDLVPTGCHLKEATTEKGTWRLYIPIYRVGTHLTFYFYTEGSELNFTHAQENGRDHKLSADEAEILEEVYAWLDVDGRFTDIEEDDDGQTQTH